jgi:hypothetical protein
LVNEMAHLESLLELEQRKRREIWGDGAQTLSVSGDRTSRASLYEISVLMKRPLRGGWLFRYIEPVTQWNRRCEWHPDIGIRIGFDALFWALASVPTEVRS